MEDASYVVNGRESGRGFYKVCAEKVFAYYFSKS